MKRLQEANWPALLLAAGALALAGAWAAWLGAAPLTVRANVLVHTEPISEIWGALTVGQSVLAPYAGLYRVDVSLAAYEPQNSGPVHLRLWSAPPGDPAAEVVAESQFRANEIRGDVMRQIEFPAVSNSAGQQYYFELSAPDGRSGSTITPYWQPSGPYPDGTAYVAGEAVDGDLVFVLHFRPSGWERVSILLQQMTPGKPRPLVWGWPPAVLFVAYAAMAALVLWGIGRLARPAD